MNFFRLSLFLSSLSIVLSHEIFDTHLLPRPLILEYHENKYSENGGFDSRGFEEEVQLQCTSWRFAVETNNLGPWKTIPPECADYVKSYMTTRAYNIDLERVSKEAGVYAKIVELSEDGKDAWVFDVDETLISNLPYYADHGYG